MRNLRKLLPHLLSKRRLLLIKKLLKFRPLRFRLQ
jgi:hypothetical protein